MKALYLNDTNTLELGALKLQCLKNNEIRIQIIASGVNPIDYQMRELEHERQYLFSPILGRELSGVVVAVGKSVTEFDLGDAVYCACGSLGSNGTYATHIQVPSEIAVLKPQNIRFEQAAAIPSVGITAVQAVERTNPMQSDRIAVFGASGGVGLFIVKLLLARGCTNLWVTVGNAQTYDKMVALGILPEQIFNYKKASFAEYMQQNAALRLDFIYDCVGHTYAEWSAKLLRTGGTYANITNFISPKTHETLFSKAIAVYHISNFGYAIDTDFQYFKKALTLIKQWIEADLITPPDIHIIEGLNVETVEKAHLMLKQNLTKGHKLIVLNQ